jgi:CBS domain-containing protein
MRDEVMKAHEVMSTDIPTVRATATVEEIARLLHSQRVGAVPVVDEASRVIGIVTVSDLFLKGKRVPHTSDKHPALFGRWVKPEQLPELYEEALHLTAADVMTTDVTYVDVEDTLGHVARLMVKSGLKRLPVLRDGKLAGMMTRAGIVGRLVRRGKVMR